jgi:hypothetical protein
MHSEPARWCPKCHVQIAPYDVRTVYNKTIYHHHCFLIVVREEASHQKNEARAAGPLKNR